MDIKKHRFVPKISTTSKVFLDKKQKSKTRAELKHELKHRLEETSS